MGILYETTGFKLLERGDEKTMAPDKQRFWQNYQDFEELGSTNLVREDKNEEVKNTAKQDGSSGRRNEADRR